MPAPNEITPIQLNRLIGTPNCPRLIDVCIDEDFNDDPRLIPTSIRHGFSKIEDLVAQLAGQNVVVICHKGLKLSQGAAALLRTHGIHAEVLEGGIVDWRAAGLPMIPAASIPENGLWVTRHRPKIDRIACPWLIRRFVDPTAQFLFVSPTQVLNVADRYNATPFDVPDCNFTHQGANCTFDAMLKEFALSSPALDKMAQIIRGADTDSHDLTPEAAGLSAISLGLSRMYRDDLEQLDAGMVLYDALYRWARDAQSETHNWDTAPANSGPK